MKRSEFTEAQNVFALLRAEIGVKVEEVFEDADPYSG
jgi:hypothetical protein